MAKHNGRLSPRQKMINLMYIVLTAMLALNVSSDVLEGFTQVEDGLSRSNATVALRNDAILNRLRAFSSENPAKGTPWLEKAEKVRLSTDTLINVIDSLKHAIVIAADGPDGNLTEIRRREDLESAAAVMLNPSTRQGSVLRKDIDKYKEFIAGYVSDSVKCAGIMDALSTGPVKSKGSSVKRLWEEAKFENQPVVAAVTLLTKLQNDIRFAEGEALAGLLANVDAGDVRVNELNAFVIPRSRLVMKGEKYSANIVLAAVDTTARPGIYVNGTKMPLEDGLYEVVPGSTGTFDYSGYLEVSHGDGSVTKHPFRSEYTVVEPTATVSATMMNVLYAGIDNPISISVPGVAPSNVSASMTNGTLVRNGNNWIARPDKIGQDAQINVSVAGQGGSHSAGSMTFRVRRLPDPTAYLLTDDNNGEKFRGERPIPKAKLLASKGLGASIDDGVLDIGFSVTGFETVFIDQMGNALPEKSNGNLFSSRQLDKFRRMSRGKRFYISRIRVVGPDGIERSLSPMEIIVN